MDRLTTEQAAGALGVTPCRVRQLIAEGALTAQRVGRRLLLVDPETVAAYAANRRPAGWPTKADREASNG